MVKTIPAATACCIACWNCAPFGVVAPSDRLMICAWLAIAYSMPDVRLLSLNVLFEPVSARIDRMVDW